MNDRKENQRSFENATLELERLHLQRALYGLCPEQMLALAKLEAELGVDGEDFNEIDRCVAAVDVWITESDEDRIELSRLQQEKIFRQFSGHQERQANEDEQHKSTGRKFWKLRWVTSAAASLALICAMVLTWPNSDSAKQTALSSNQVKAGIHQLRQAMIDNPPADMLRWVWTNRLQDEPKIKGDVIWSDLLQRGFAMMTGEPHHLLNQYELRAFPFENGENGVLCGEFHFDPDSNSIVMRLIPESRVERPNRFSVRPRTLDELESEGKSKIDWIVRAEAPSNPFPESESLVSDTVEESNSEPLSSEESVTAMQ